MILICIYFADLIVLYLVIEFTEPYAMQVQVQRRGRGRRSANASETRTEGTGGGRGRGRGGRLDVLVGINA